MSMMGAAPPPATNPMQGGPQQPPMQQQPMQPPQQPPVEPEGEQPDDDQFQIDAALQSINLAERMRKSDEKNGETDLEDLGNDVVDDYETDETSRVEWMERNKEWMKLATQVKERKTFPWEGAANVKYPLLTTAALQFASRAYPSLVPSFDIVKAKVMGPDPEGKMTDLANTLSTHMSYQILYEMEGWEEDLDTLCFVLPIVGVMFKKTYYSEIQKCNVSELVHAKDFVVNYYTKGNALHRAPRYTHIIYLTPNEIKERQNYKLFLEYDEKFESGLGDDTSYSEGKTTGLIPFQGAEDEDTPRKILEQYRWIDLDEDGYKEPYIVTVDYETRRVLRVVPNFSIKGVDRDEKNKIICIEPNKWFTKFGFIPNPDGGFYDLGFGLLLGGINEAVNTLTNQLLDAGTISNLQAGFIAKGLRIGGKDLKFKAGEWKIVNAIGDDLKKSIMPLPANQPSAVLFQLLGTLAQSGKELASVAEIFTGKMPGQNTPAATTMAAIEQGLKVFTSIYKRIYRAMQQEFTRLYELNQLYMPTQTIKFVAEVNGQPKQYSISRFDYQDDGVKIMPAADPNMVSETQKMMKIQGLHELVQLGTINTQEMTKQALIFQGQENIPELMNVPQPPPPIEIQLKQMELQDKDKDRQIEQMKVMSAVMLDKANAALALAKAKSLGNEQDAMMWEAQLEAMTQRQELMMKYAVHNMDMHAQQQKMEMDAVANTQKIKQQQETHAQQLAQQRDQHAQGLAQGQDVHNSKKMAMDDMAKAKAKAAALGGTKTI